MIKKTFLNSGFRGADPLQYLLAEGKQYFTSEQYQELIKIAKERGVKPMQSVQTAEMLNDKLSASQI